MSLTFEKIYPSLFAIAACILALSLQVSLPTNDSYLAGLLSASISTAAIFVGFIATAKSILMALSKTVKNNLHFSGFMPTLACYLSHAMAGNLIFCALNISGFFPLVQCHMIIFSAI